MSDTHTATEVGHEAGHKGPFPPFDTTYYPSQILWFAITFGLLYYVVQKVLHPKLGDIVEGRAKRIADDFAAAEKAKAESEAAAAAYERDLAEARRKAGDVVAASRAKVMVEVDARRAAAETNLAGRLAEAETRIADIKAKALAEVGAIATDTAEAIVAALAGTPAGRDEVASAVAAIKP